MYFTGGRRSLVLVVCQVPVPSVSALTRRSGGVNVCKHGRGNAYLADLRLLVAVADEFGAVDVYSWPVQAASYVATLAGPRPPIATYSAHSHRGPLRGLSPLETFTSSVVSGRFWAASSLHSPPFLQTSERQCRIHDGDSNRSLASTAVGLNGQACSLRWPGKLAWRCMFTTGSVWILASQDSDSTATVRVRPDCCCLDVLSGTLAKRIVTVLNCRCPVCRSVACG